MKYAVRTENLTKTYKTGIIRKQFTHALKGLSIEVPANVVFGFLGPNGAGKTTTIRCLMDLIRPTSGHAWVLDRPVGELSIKEKIGFLPDSPTFGSHLTAFQFLGLASRLLKIPKSDIEKRVDEVLAIVKMTQYKNERLGGFSRGMTQRIGIAQAILNKPELLVLDEPLVGLDPHGRKELMDIIYEQRERGSSIFFCSHILSDVQSACDYVGIVAQGNLKAFGKMNELLADSSVTVNIRKEAADIAQKIMPLAKSIDKQESGEWSMVLTKEEWTKVQGMDINIEDNIKVKPGHKTLENFFFETVEKGTVAESK
jgi:ABC-2 type transport system ATP-binding protein